MAKVAQSSQLKQFRQQVEQYIEVVEAEAGFYSDSEWRTLVLTKIQEISEPLNTGELALLCGMIEVWGTDRGIDSDLK